MRFLGGALEDGTLSDDDLATVAFLLRPVGAEELGSELISEGFGLAEARPFLGLVTLLPAFFVIDDSLEEAGMALMSRLGGFSGNGSTRWGGSI